MKAIVCEMCGSQELIKQNGLYICQNCGTKYSTEEARKLMVEVSGTVRIDNSQKVENYYQIARRAKETGNNEDAAKYYDLIRQEKPNDWEASFYATYYAAMQTNIAGIANAANTIANGAIASFKLIAESPSNDEEKINACRAIKSSVFEASTSLFRATIDFYNKYRSTSSAAIEKDQRVSAIMNSLILCGDAIEMLFANKNEFCRDIACDFWESAISSSSLSIPLCQNEYVLADKVKKYKPEYKLPKKGGCYVATAVYGSYDCPQVWTLRRYRDNVLANTWYGRVFICFYYAVSPMAVRLFGKTTWFRNMWKPKLDRMVKRLNEEGITDYPYQDKQW